MIIKFQWNNYHPSYILKCVQIFLSILIIMGIALIFTQKMWVPNVVEYILENEEGVFKVPETVELPGSDRDVHGCIGSAGYAWCDARQECERPWERYCTAATPKSAFFTCDGNKTITTTFYPTDDAYVDLVLSDGRTFSVPKAISASGARYARADESFVFWNKGNSAFVTENGDTTFVNCITKN